MTVFILHVGHRERILGVYASYRAVVKAKREYNRRERAWRKSQRNTLYDGEYAEYTKREVWE